MSRLAAADKVRRDAGVVADRARGLTWATIAQRHDLTPRACQLIWSQRASGDSATLLIDPQEALLEALEQLDRMAEDCSLLWESTRNDSIKVAALKQRHAVMADRFRLLMAVGVLPSNLGGFATEIDAVELGRVLLELFDRHGLDDDALQELQALLPQRHPAPASPRLLEVRSSAS